MVTENTVLDRFKGLVAFQLGIKQEEVKDDSRFEDLGADSLDLVELLMAAEDEFNIDINDPDAEDLHTSSEAAKYLNERLGVSA